jgi:hypothetical protein
MNQDEKKLTEICNKIIETDEVYKLMLPEKVPHLKETWNEYIKNNDIKLDKRNFEEIRKDTNKYLYKSLFDSEEFNRLISET